MKDNLVGTELTRSDELVAGDGNLKLHRYGRDKDARYGLILTAGGTTPKYLRLFLVGSEYDAINLYTVFHTNLLPLLSVTNMSTNANKLQDVCNVIRKRQQGGLVHVCVELGLLKALQSKHPEIERNINTIDETNSTPLHTACAESSVGEDMVQQLIYMGADASARDAHGNTPVFIAAQSNPKKLKMLLSKQAKNSTQALSTMTMFGETPVHVACSTDQPECLEILLEAGAYPHLSESYKWPIHCAVRKNSIKCLELLVKKSPALVNCRDGKHGATPLHWARSRKAIMCLLKAGADFNARSKTEDTALHIMLKEDRRDCVNALVIMGADVSIPDQEGLTPLHIAIPKDDLAMVRSLVVHGADINTVDRNGKSPRHMAATSTKRNGAHILYTLHMIGATRCDAGQAGCNDGCRHGGKFDGKEFVQINDESDLVDECGSQPSYYCDGCNELLMGLHTSQSVADNLMAAGSVSNTIGDGLKVLCLDGGGIRGLVLSVVLMKLEKAVDTKLIDCFDWISGTSTGGILTLGLAHGLNARHCLGLYFRLKDKVFCGGKPYNSEDFEAVLKEEFGADTPMSALKKPKVLVTALLADRHPPDLFLFKNYVNPLETVISLESRLCHKSEPIPKPEGIYISYLPYPKIQDVKVWEAARSSGAAPTFFRASMNRFLDGGLMANNPTLDTLTEIQEYNSGLKATNQAHLIRPVTLVVSVGTGRMPKVDMSAIDVFRPGGLMDAVKVVQGAQSLIKILVEQATQSEGRPNERARAWCSMIGASFFRFSPLLSQEVQIDDTDDDRLHLMCWETMVYLHRKRDVIDKLADMLNPYRNRQ